MTTTIPFMCPVCDATPSSPQAFLCGCPLNEASKQDIHGECHENPCPMAFCQHCGWRGQFPLTGPRPLRDWEKKAIEAGWKPPKARAKEIALLKTRVA